MRGRPRVPITGGDTGGLSEDMVLAAGNLAQLSDGLGQVPALGGGLSAERLNWLI
jgi:hypothetical protein